jgi:hypothetical protein
LGKVYVRSIRQGRETVVAVCDEEVLGKTLEGGRVPFTVHEGFYKGVLGEVDEALDAIKQATICNLVGKTIVEAAIDSKMVHKRAVIYFGEVPHAQIVKL